MRHPTIFHIVVRHCTFGVFTTRFIYSIIPSRKSNLDVTYFIYPAVHHRVDIVGALEKNVTQRSKILESTMAQTLEEIQGSLING